MASAEDLLRGTLAGLALAGRSHAVVSAITRDPDPRPTHKYERSRFSGSGNCVCGLPERHRRHPHEFMGADHATSRCTCALPRNARCHSTKDGSVMDYCVASEGSESRG